MIYTILGLLGLVKTEDNVYTNKRALLIGYSTNVPIKRLTLLDCLIQFVRKYYSPTHLKTFRLS